MEVESVIVTVKSSAIFERDWWNQPTPPLDDQRRPVQTYRMRHLSLPQPSLHLILLRNLSATAAEVTDQKVTLTAIQEIVGESIKGETKPSDTQYQE